MLWNRNLELDESFFSVDEDYISGSPNTSRNEQFVFVWRKLVSKIILEHLI